MVEPVAASNLTLAVGDRVVYPNQGVCRVSGVEAKEVAGQTLTFVTMKREEDGAVVMVPQGKLQSIGLRKVATRDEVLKIFAFLKSDSDKADLDWKQRARTNSDRMAQGGLLGLAEVVKGLQVLSELRPLPAKERELYDNARHLLVTEISVSLTIAECDAEDAVDLVLFPPGRERPKRTAAEFKPGGEDGEDLDLGDDLLGMDSEGMDSQDEEAAEGEEEEGEEGDGKKKPAARAPLSDDDVTVPMGAALVPDEQMPPKRKRGRPPKPKPPEAELAAAVPKKRGRPPKPKPPEAEVPAVPKKRGRPPKAKTEAADPKAAAKAKKK